MQNVSNRKPILVVQGGQWGSEAKGAIAAALCIQRNIHYAIRTGAINAGHTVVYQGKKYAMQQIPTGWVNPNTQLVIGAGAYIHPDTLWAEIDMINRAMPHLRVQDRLFVDKRCGIHDMAAEKASKDANRHHKIGATGKGCSEAIVAKIRDRNNGYELFINTKSGKDTRNDNGVKFVDTVKLLNNVIDAGKQLLIEGTQGTLLDLHLGPYPFTTSRMTSAANWVAESGLSPALDYEVVLVCRTYPIRVAGNSGPMDNEIEWVDLARAMNQVLASDGMPPVVDELALVEFEKALQDAAVKAAHSERYQTPTTPDGKSFNVRLSGWSATYRDIYRVAASELHRDALQTLSFGTLQELKTLFEMTTVTKKLRRLAELSLTDLEFAIAVNRPSWIALTFMDYVEPGLAGTTVETLKAAEVGSQYEAVTYRAAAYIRDLQHRLSTPIKMISTGPNPENAFGTGWLLDNRSER